MAEAIEALQKMLEEGATLGTAIALILAVLKLLEGRHNTKRNKEISADLKVIKHALGVSEWPGNVSSSKATTKYSATKSATLYISRLGASITARRAKRFIILTSRREREMNDQQTKVIGIIVAILGAAKLVLESFQIDLIDDNFTNAVTNIVAAGFTIWGIFKNHHKPVDAPLTPEEKNYH